ncbi:CPBP family intramembrane glutamic endopeptidase [Pontibacter anaerobius]|uniref:Type II CAAX endopeptidase family protein n=1 Tax=Pontibacter anaerobius TaxID=2993940 RepID=A0ABT3RGW9_9BACT|nr:type II CAAX endopeptidase family protein [Pontibacter anaerobius]MCX2741083.1 type II CAAX endopeptidase family protein [Pontibacter anaerobius]
MIGILVTLTISWILLYLIEKRSILSLGFLPLIKRLKQFVIGFLITAVLCIGVQSLEALLTSSHLFLNKKLNASLLLSMFWWDFKSVLTEELIFRGALLYILLRRFGSEKGIVVSAVAFGIYHWFSFGIFGNIIPMLFVFIGTGLMGYAWALAFSKTHSIFMPIGLHLGWNFTFNTIFSKGPLGDGLLVSSGGNMISDWFSLISLWGVPITVLLIVKYLVRLDNGELKETQLSRRYSLWR